MPRGGRGVATRQRDIAVRCQRRLWAEWSAATDDTGTHGIRTAEKWLAEFRDYNRLHASEDHAAYNCLIVRRMLTAANVGHLTSLCSAHAETYLTGLKAAGRSTRTIQAHRNALHKFCRFLVRRDVLDANPVDAIEVAPPAKRPPRFLDDGQRLAAIKHLSETLPAWMFDAVCLALHCGARLGSLMALQCEHVKPAALVLPLPKVGDYAIVPTDSPIIGPELAVILKRVHAGRPGTQSMFPRHGQQWWVKRLRDSTGPLPVFGELPGCRAGNQWHLLRATWAVNCARRGATLWQLMEWGGWREPTTVMRYVNIARAAGTITGLDDRPCEAQW